MAWLTARDAARYIGRKAPTAYKRMLFLARAKKIKSGNDGKTFLFNPEDLDAWLYANSDETTDKTRRKRRPGQFVKVSAA